MYQVKAPVPNLLSPRDSKEIKEKNLSNMMSSDLDNILEAHQHFPRPKQTVDTNK